MYEGVAADEGAADLRVARGRAQDRDLASGGVDLTRGRAEQPDLRVSREKPQLPIEALGQRQVVGVEAGHERRPRQPEGGVQRRREAAAGAPRDAEPGIAEGLEDRGCRVRGCVVDHDQLKLGYRLGEDALDGLSHLGRPVPDAHQHRDGRSRHRGPVPRRRVSMASTEAK